MKTLIGLVLALGSAPWGSAAAAEETLGFGRFGAVTLYRATSQPAHVVLFVSGDGGWNLGVVDMARALTGLDALVVGVDITHYLEELGASSEKCLYPAADFEALSQFVQQKLAFPRYVRPVLVGYSSGATLVYAVLVQAPPPTFAGALSLGFCPDLPLATPLCKGRGLEWGPGPKGKGYSFKPGNTLETPWVVFQGLIDQVCDPAVTPRFVAATRNARLVSLPGVGHGFSVPRNWMPQFRQAFSDLVKPVAASAPPPGGPVAAASTAVEVGELPIVELPVSGGGDFLAVIVSGDGGWASIDREIGTVLAARGIPVVGLDSLQYFWHARTPDEAGRDLNRILAHYAAAWGKARFLLVGYSFGAEVLPFMASRLPAELRARVALLAMIAPGRKAEFEFHLGDWLGGGDAGTPIAPEVDKLAGTKVLCLWGEDDGDSLCPTLAPALATGVQLRGGHHFGGDYHGIADEILRAAGSGASPAP